MSFSKNQISVCFILSLFNDIIHLKIMPKKRKRGGALSYRRKHNRPGRSFIRSYENGSNIYLPNDMHNIEIINNNNLGNDEHCSDDYYSCSESNREKNSHSFEWRQRVTISHLYESLFDFMSQCQRKEFKLIYKIR